jgi:hypothetical protein
MFKDPIKNEIKKADDEVQQASGDVVHGADEPGVGATLPGKARAKLHLSHSREVVNAACITAENAGNTKG